MPRLTIPHTDEALLLAPVDWSALYESLDTNQRYELERQLSQDAVQLARLAAYISRRQTGGKHDDAVKAQNTAARKVRQALGYTYADDKITF